MRNNPYNTRAGSVAKNRAEVISLDKAGKRVPYREGLADVANNLGYPKQYDTWTEFEQLAYERGRLAAAAAIGRGEDLPKWRLCTYPAKVARLFNMDLDGFPQR